MVASAGMLQIHREAPQEMLDLHTLRHIRREPLDFGGDKRANYRIWVKTWSDVIEPAEPLVLRVAIVTSVVAAGGESLYLTYTA